MNKKWRISAVLCTALVVFSMGCGGQSQTAGTNGEQGGVPESTALIPKWVEGNNVEPNPYFSAGEASIHNDIYGSDVTGKAMPLGIYPEIIEGVAEDSPNSPPAFFYDNEGHAIAPYSQLMEDGSVLAGGIAIRDMDSPTLEVKGKFQPYLDDNGARYGIQISYAFVDKDNYLVGPTTNGHAIMVQTSDEQGEILPVFRKVLDVDIVASAVKALGEDIDQNLLSMTYDYEGNLWFVTGGFHKNPAYSKAGFLGYLDREYIDRYFAGETQLNPEDYLHYQKLGDGENAENGIAAHSEGCVILTNQACYLLDAVDHTVNIRWRMAYESSGGKTAKENAAITGGGLAWGGGSSPTLTRDLVLFTDNQDVVQLIAVDIKTGEKVASIPVLDLGDEVIVSVENSISVYAADAEQTSVLVCNWYGAGSAALNSPDTDSSVQSYDNLYDTNWREKGSAYLMPGVERVDIIKNEDGSYQAQRVWIREDLKDTCMIKFSTGAGYYYGYTQNEETSEWGFFALDFDTGETVLWVPASDSPAYNNIAVGIMQGDNGNAIYSPTNSQTLVRLQDRFAYLPDEPEKQLDIINMKRQVMSEEQFQNAAGTTGRPATYLLSATADDVKQECTIAFRVNGLSGLREQYTGYYATVDNGLKKMDTLLITDETGREIEAQEEMKAAAIYEIHVTAETLSEINLAQQEDRVTVSVLLAVE